MMVRTSVNVVWKMKGVDVRLDTKIGLYLARLVDTMTIITGNSNAGRYSSTSEKFNESGSLGDFDVQLSEDVIKDVPKRKGKEKTEEKKKSWKEKLRKVENEYNEQVCTSYI